MDVSLATTSPLDPAHWSSRTVAQYARPFLNRSVHMDRTERGKNTWCFSLKEKEDMLETTIFIIILIGVDLIAIRWGANSCDAIDNPEWERRQHWYGFY